MTSTIIFDPQATDRTPSDIEQITLRDRSGAELIATVQSESFSSIAVKLAFCTFKIGDALEVEYGGAMMQAFVHRFDEQADGSWLVALHWGSSAG